MTASYFHTYIVVFCILWSLIMLMKRSILSSLISLEFLHYVLFLLFYWSIPFMFGSLSMIVVLLCFAASGAALGLSILVTLSRQSGSDLIMSAL
uniref:NADH dehydrogenase subunit 4L n=1 Tax=Euhadra congenita congenita TaxID=244813 RepID=Q75Z33_9EUPU|nr:NADH dehydrogenase subunit 4L [Euhadra congenita congenita]